MKEACQENWAFTVQSYYQNIPTAIGCGPDLSGSMLGPPMKFSNRLILMKFRLLMTTNLLVSAAIIKV